MDDIKSFFREYYFFVLVVIALAIGSWVSIHKQAENAEYKEFDFRTFDRPIIADAPGCEIRSPQGDLMNKLFKDAPTGGLTIQKGTTFTIDCFPIQESEKSTTVDPQTNKSEPDVVTHTQG